MFYTLHITLFILLNGCIPLPAIGCLAYTNILSRFQSNERLFLWFFIEVYFLFPRIIFQMFNFSIFEKCYTYNRVHQLRTDRNSFYHTGKDTGITGQAFMCNCIIQVSYESTSKAYKSKFLYNLSTNI